MCITGFGIADFLEFLDLIREWYRVDSRYSLDGGRGQAWVVVVTVTGSLANSVHNNLSSLFLMDRCAQSDHYQFLRAETAAGMERTGRGRQYTLWKYKLYITMSSLGTLTRHLLPTPPPKCLHHLNSLGE